MLPLISGIFFSFAHLKCGFPSKIRKLKRLIRIKNVSMTHRALRSFGLIGKLLAFFLFVSSTSVLAQDYEGLPVVDYSKPAEYEIKNIKVRGIKYLDHNALIQLSGLYVGQKLAIPGDETTRAIEKLWRQGLFSDVKLAIASSEGNKIDLEIYLQERPRVSKVEFRGAKKSEEKKIRELLNISVGSQVTDNVTMTAKKKIRDFYLDKGRYNAEVLIVQKNDTVMKNGVILVFNINRNNRTHIDEINIEGNTVLTDGKIRKAMKETKRNKWYLFYKASKFIEKNFKDDKKLIIEKYNELGYRDAKIVSDSLYHLPNGDLGLTITVFEGRKYYFGDINWVGNTKFTTEQLNQVLNIKKGDVYDKTILNKRLTTDDDAVSNLYLDDGYLFFNLTPVEVSVENDSINLEMRMQEGRQATINKVIIKGNTKTNEHVIRREIRTRPGQLFSKTAIMRTIRELAQLGHFDPEKLDVKPIPNQADGTVDLQYVVEERANDQIEISGGWGAGQIVGTLGLRFNNFSTRNFFDKTAWRPLPTGDGQTLSVRAQSSGTRYQAYNMTFVEPWLGGKRPNALSVSVFHTRQTVPDYYVGDEKFDNPSQTITGASVGLGVRLKWPDDYFTMRNDVGFRRYRMHNWRYSIFTNGTSNDFGFTHTIARNSIDNPIYTRRGSSFQLSLKWTPPFSLLSDKDYKNADDNEKYEWVEYHKWNFSAQWYTPIAGDLVLSSKAWFGFLGYYNDDIGASPFGKFRLGGDGMSGYSYYGVENIALRGYSNGSLSSSSGDNLYNKFSMELRYPLSLNPSATVYGFVFAEGGKSWQEFDSYDPFGIYRSAGVGVRMFLPMLGMIGIDWGYGFDDVPGDPSASGSQWHFVLGQQF